MNRLFKSMEGEAQKNPHHPMEVGRNDIDHVIAVGIIGFKYPILKVIIREPLPGSNSYEESLHKAIRILFGPQELEMFNHGREHELADLESLIGMYLANY